MNYHEKMLLHDGLIARLENIVNLCKDGYVTYEECILMANNDLYSFIFAIMDTEFDDVVKLHRQAFKNYKDWVNERMAAKNSEK